jgi:hypothetical protein
MNNKDKARLIIDRLEYEGEDLSNEALCIVADALDEIDATNDPYMPADVEWEAHPEAMAAATDENGAMYLYEKEPSPGTVVWWNENGGIYELLRFIAPPADFHTTLRRRPEGI